MLVSILIPTLLERTSTFIPMVEDLYQQIKDNDLEKKVEVISICDNRNMTLPEKRNKLQKMAKGKYFTHLDDDDKFTEDYCMKVIEHIETLKEDVDIIGYNQLAYVADDTFVVKSSPHFGLKLEESPEGSKYKDYKTYYRTPWQWCLFNRERFGMVSRSDIDTNAMEDQNWLVRVHLERPESYSHIDWIGHEYHFEDPSKSTCQ